MSALDFEDLSFLVVDDNEYICRLVEAALHHFGAKHVVTFQEAPFALECYQENQTLTPFDMAIVDHQMKPMTGTELVTSIHQEDRLRGTKTPILMITAYSDPSLVRDAVEAGVTAVLSKPFSPLALYSSIGYAIHNTDESAGRVFH